MTTIISWAKDERPREKLLKKGSNALSDAELLAILLRIGKKGKTAVDLARELLQDFNGLRNLLESDQKKLCNYSGIGIAKYVQLQAALELARRHLYQTLEHKNVIRNSKNTKNYLITRLRHYKKEVFACIFLNNHNYIIGYEELFFGTINASVIHPREVVKKALHYNAVSIILAHNHPSGDTKPSQADIEITSNLIESLKLVDIKVLDHVIVGEGSVTSFFDEDLI